MRHLRVPKRETQSIFEALRALDWLPSHARIFNDGEYTLIPVSTSAPLTLPEDFSQFRIVSAEQPEPPVQNWLERLHDFLPAEVISQNEGIWPTAQEVMGDLLLFKVESPVVEYTEQIALAKLAHLPPARLALLDNGVAGEFRVRQLQPVAVKIDGKPTLVSELEEVDSEKQAQLLNTRTLVREHMRSIRVDPSKVYYSSRLQAERWRTVESAEILRRELGRPISVADPYCGCGPALVHLLKRPDLVGGLLASDLNPDAVDLLLDNLRRWKAPDVPDSVTDLAEYSEGYRYGIADALKLANDSELCGQFDLLLVNIPHDTIEHLPNLLPLLKRGSTTLVRGWVVADESQMSEIDSELQQLLTPIASDHHPPRLEQRKQFNSTEWLCRFEAWLNLTE